MEGVITEFKNQEVGQPPRMPISDSDQQEVVQLYEAIRKGDAKLVGPNGEARPLPASLHAFLVEAVSLLQQGKSIYIIQKQAKLTTIEAAAMLGVSRQFLVGVLERNEIPYHMVGTHRRIYAKDLLSYKAQRDAKREKIIDDLAKAEAEDGIYGVLASDGN
jgi:excisionase family DNA binding protein